MRVEDALDVFDREARRWHILISWLVLGSYLLFSFMVTIIALSFRVFLMTVFYLLPPDWSPLFGAGGSGGRSGSGGSSVGGVVAANIFYAKRVSVGSITSVLFTATWSAVSTKVGTWLGIKLTEFENHRRQGDHDAALLHKKFAIRFVNYYSAFFYIAFLKASSAGELIGGVFFWFERPFSWMTDHLLWLAFLGQIPAEQDVVSWLATDASEYEHLITRDYCHDLSNFTLSDAEIKEKLPIDKRLLRCM